MDLLLFAILVMLDKSKATVPYSRDLLQKQYPGFGNYVIFPGENGEDVYGYLDLNKSIDETEMLPDTSIETMYSSKGRKAEYTFFSEDEDSVGRYVSFTLYSRSNPEGWEVNNLEDLPKFYNDSKKTKFVTHGYKSSGKSDTCILIKNGFLKKFDVNVFIMDWSPLAGHTLYYSSMQYTTKVAKYYAQFLNYLVNTMHVSPDDIHIIGHSLGAHISGFAGRRVEKGKIARITGLDPALPGFNIGLVEGGHLNSNDSKFVDVIHTCAGFLGMKDPIGHVDFYPNGGGPPQPGCDILKLIEACSHGRSWKLFADSILMDVTYMATECPNFSNFNYKVCNGRRIPMGEPTPTDARGIYYMATSGVEPFTLQDSTI